jgi:hypothetical protein
MSIKYLTGFAVVAIALTSCSQQPSNRQMQLETRHLTHAFAALENHQVAAYRNQDWCKNIVYKRGKFSDQPHQSTCNLFLEAPQIFDAQAIKDFDEVATAIAHTEVDLHYITRLDYDAEGTLTQAQFHLATTFGRYSYVYAPNYQTLPPNIANEIEHTAINEDWYAVWEDWN